MQQMNHKVYVITPGDAPLTREVAVSRPLLDLQAWRMEYCEQPPLEAGQCIIASILDGLDPAGPGRNLNDRVMAVECHVRLALLERLRRAGQTPEWLDSGARVYELEYDAEELLLGGGPCCYKDLVVCTPDVNPDADAMRELRDLAERFPEHLADALRVAKERCTDKEFPARTHWLVQQAARVALADRAYDLAAAARRPVRVRASFRFVGSDLERAYFLPANQPLPCVYVQGDGMVVVAEVTRDLVRRLAADLWWGEAVGCVGCEA